MVHPASLQPHYIPQAMPLSSPNPYFSEPNPAFIAALEANAPGITQLAVEAIKIQNEVTQLNARLFQNPVQFTNEPYFAIIQLVLQWIPFPSYLPPSQSDLFGVEAPVFPNIAQDMPIPQPDPDLYTNTLDTHAIAMTFFHQMFPNEQQVADIANATLSDCPVLFSGQDHLVIAQLIPQLQVSFNPYHALAPQAEPLLLNPAQPSSTNYSFPATDVVPMQDHQYDKTAPTKSKSKRKRYKTAPTGSKPKKQRVYLGPNLILRAKQYISWLKTEHPHYWSSPSDKWGSFKDAFFDLCEPYLDQVEGDIDRLKGALSSLKHDNKDKAIEVPEELKPIFKAIAEKTIPTYNIENKELITRAKQYISWLKAVYPDSWSRPYNKWSAFIDKYRDLCASYLEKVKGDETKLKHALSCLKYEHKETETEVPEEIKAEFKELTEKALALAIS